MRRAPGRERGCVGRSVMDGAASRARWDVIVIGGGLAGSAAAIALRQAGRSVLLIERYRYPRHKLCGEFLSPETASIFRQLKVWETIRTLSPAPIRFARISAPRGVTLDIPLPAPALGLSRYRLDALLLDGARAAGATVLEGCIARGVEGSLAEEFGVLTREGQYRARVVLAAWGKRSSLDRVLGRPFFDEEAPFIAIKAHYRGPQPAERTELHAFSGGYCGINHVEEGLVNVCLLATRAAWERAGRDVEGCWQMARASNPSLDRQLRGAEKVSHDLVISNISFKPRAVVEREILMLGDSAALISPLAGNGQAMALRSALLATPLVEGFLSSRLSPAEMLAGYEAGWRRAFSTRLALGRALQPLFLKPRALSLALRLASRAPWLARWLVEGTREKVAYGEQEPGL